MQALSASAAAQAASHAQQRRPACVAAAAARVPAGRQWRPAAAPRRSCSRLAAEAGDASPAAGTTVEIPTKLNTIPHERETRQWFYRDLKEGVRAALAAGEKRIIARSTFPELNTEFDVYRVGTLLELVREVVSELAATDPALRIKVCVQQPLGAGVFAGTPLSLNGVMRIMGMMDWGDAKDRISCSNMIAGAEVEGADAFVLVSPQNIVGHSIQPFLEEMTAAAAAAGKPMVLINPKLTDIQSAGGVMSVRGRQERLDFMGTYPTAYHFRLLYRGVTMYPIMGALRHSYGGPWQVFRRVQLAGGREEYALIGSFEEEPKAPQITEAFRMAWAEAQKAAAGA